MSEDKFLYWRMLMAPTGKYVIDKIKKPLMKAITTLAKSYPEYPAVYEYWVVEYSPLLGGDTL